MADASVGFFAAQYREAARERRAPSRCLKEKRDPDCIKHTVEEMLRLRMFTIAAGHERL
jgi:hypothetical protein